MGETWDAQHPPFHLHLDESEDRRHTTGRVELIDVLTELEAVLAPECRLRRLKSLLNKGGRAYQSLLDELGETAFKHLVQTVHERRLPTDLRRWMSDNLS